MAEVEHYIDEFGNKKWTSDGKLHREDGPAVICANGDQWWVQHGELHRDDGPAVVYADGTCGWLQHGKLHREGGPAVIRTNSVVEWHHDGDEYSFDEYCKKLKLTPEVILELKVKYE